MQDLGSDASLLHEARSSTLHGRKDGRAVAVAHEKPPCLLPVCYQRFLRLRLIQCCSDRVMACRTSAVMVLFCIKPAAALSTDMKRAELLRWLIDNHPAIDLSAVNAHLQTPVHSALQSHSLEVLEVRSRCLATICNPAQHGTNGMALPPAWQARHD